MHFFGSNTVSWGISGSTNPLDTRCWCKDPMPRGTGKVPDAEHRAVMFACGLVQLDAIPVTWSKVSLPIEAHNPLLLACHKDLVSNFSFGPFTLLQTAQRWGRWGLLLPFVFSSALASYTGEVHPGSPGRGGNR